MESLERIFNFSNMVVGAILSTVLIYLGGNDGLLKAVLIAMVFDFITGTLRAFKTRQISSRIGFNGILRKGIILGVVVFAVALDNALVMSDDLVNSRRVILMFYLGNEGLSIIENCQVLNVPIPKILIKTLNKLRDTK